MVPSRSSNTAGRPVVTRDLPVLALSARATPADIRRGREAGFCEYLTKPLQIPLLVEALSYALAMRAAPPADAA